MDRMSRQAVARELQKRHVTAFQMKVLLATYDIPKGEVMSYKQVAKMAGYPLAYRAVGSVMKMNPLAPDIPCHRVIKSNGDTGNYSGKGGPGAKIRMLKMEKAI